MLNLLGTWEDIHIYMLLENEIIMIEVPQEVRVRKYEVDIPSLQTLIRQAKKDSKITNK